MTLALGLTLAVGAFFAAFASGLAGFAFALVASGIFLNVLAPIEAVPLVLAGSLLAQSITLVSLANTVQWRRLWPFLAGGVIGIPFGAELLRVADAGMFRFSVGLFLIAYSLYMLIQPRRRVITGGGSAADGAIGLVGGVMGGLAGLSGAIPTIWCGLRGWPKDEQRGVYQPFIFVMQLMALLWLGGGGAIGRSTWIAFAVCLPAMLLGIWLGLRLYARVNDAQFRSIVLWLLLLSGILLVV